MQEDAHRLMMHSTISAARRTVCFHKHLADTCFAVKRRLLCFSLVFPKSAALCYTHHSSGKPSFSMFHCETTAKGVKKRLQAPLAQDDIYAVFMQYWVGFLYFLLVSPHAIITSITQEMDLFKLLSSYFKVRCVCLKKNILKKLLKDDKNLFFRPAASQSTNESFGTAGEHNDTNEDTYANSSQDSTLVMREVSLRFNLWPWLHRNRHSSSLHQICCFFTE